MTNLPANLESSIPAPVRAKKRRSFRNQAADLRMRYEALPRRQQWLVIAVLVVIAWFAVDELLWSKARGWASESERIEAALDRGAKRNSTVSADLRRSVATFGPVVPPGPAAVGREALARAIDEVARKHKVAGYSYEARTGQRVKDNDASLLGPSIDRLQAEVKFETTADELPKFIADLESHPMIDGITSLRLQKNDQNRKVTVQATIETWVIAGTGRSAR